MKYFVEVNGSSHEVVIEGDSVTVDGRTSRAHAEDVPGTPLQLITIGAEVHRALGRRIERGVYDLSMDGHRFIVQAFDERSKVIRELSGASTRAAGPAHLHAPMPGLVVRVNVREGDTVQAGQGLVVMEAMKMENELRAPAPGVVARVAAEPGTPVEKGALLVEMRPSDP
jgi:biotin carboxyl carrier protein